MEEQRRIAGILGAIDDKIENNRRINANLESQAQALFDNLRYDYTTDTSILIYVEMQSRFLVYRIKVSEPIEGIDQLSFEERVQSDDDFCERQEHFIPTNFLPF